MRQAARRRRLAVQAEEQPQEHGDAQEADQRDDVGSGQYPAQTLFLIHSAHSTGAALLGRGDSFRCPNWPSQHGPRVPEWPRAAIRTIPRACATPREWPIGQVMAPPYDVISSTERVHLASRHPANAVLVELPEPDLQGGRDRYQVAADLFARWQADGILRRRPDPVPLPLPDDRHDGTGLDGGDRRPRSGRAGPGERHPAPRTDAPQAQERPSRPAAGHPGQPLARSGGCRCGTG